MSQIATGQEGKHECITMEQMKEWKENENIGKLEEAFQLSENCPVCKRVWVRFWASQD